MVEISHERRSRGPIGHLLRRTTHIDVDDVGALLLGDARTFRHPSDLASGELHNMDPDASAVAANGGLAFSPHQAGTGRHFGNDQSRAEPFRQPAERCIGNAGHWSQNHAVRDNDRPDRQRRSQTIGIIVPLQTTAYHLGCPFHCSEISHFVPQRKCCIAKNCSFLRSISLLGAFAGRLERGKAKTDYRKGVTDACCSRRGSRWARPASGWRGTEAVPQGWWPYPARACPYRICKGVPNRFGP